MKKIMHFTLMLAFVIFASPAAVKSEPPGHALPFDTVTVNNEATNPVPVFNVDGNAVTVDNANINPVPVVDLMRALRPFQETLDLEITSGHIGTKDFFVPLPVEPKYRQVVIEHVSAYVSGPQGQEHSVSMTFGGATYWLVLTFQQTWNVSDIFHANQPMRAIVTAPGPIRFSVSTYPPITDESVEAYATICGYFVDLP
jgi:hypothetical protein